MTDFAHHTARSGESPAATEAELFTRSAARLATLFYSDLDKLGRFEAVTADVLPSEFRRLLAHQDHMTVALEAFHGALVDVHALDEWRDAASYARCSLLSRQNDSRIVQFGIMRIWLADLPAAAQREIANKQSPLGRVLIGHDILREVELIAFWRITPGRLLRQHLKCTDKTPIYGRSAQILVDERPTVQLLEIVTIPDRDGTAANRT